MSFRVDRARWAKMTIFEQMGNIGSEVSRSIKAKQAGEIQGFVRALERALDMFDATVACLISTRSARSREVLRARDQYLELFFGDENHAQGTSKLEKYFMEYALVARR